MHSKPLFSESFECKSLSKRHIKTDNHIIIKIFEENHMANYLNILTSKSAKYSVSVEESSHCAPSMVTGSEARRTSPLLSESPVVIDSQPSKLYEHKKLIICKTKTKDEGAGELPGETPPEEAGIKSKARTKPSSIAMAENKEHSNSSRSLSNSRSQDSGTVQNPTSHFSAGLKKADEHFPLNKVPVVKSDSPTTSVAPPAKAANSSSSNYQSKNSSSNLKVESGLNSGRNRSSSPRSRSNGSQQSIPRPRQSSKTTSSSSSRNRYDVSPRTEQNVLTEPTTHHPVQTSYSRPNIQSAVNSPNVTHQDSQPSSSEVIPAYLSYSETDPDYPAVKLAAECLHAQDYTKMARTLEAAPSTIPVIFGKGLAYYKLNKHSAAKREFEQMYLQSESHPDMRGNVYLAHYYIGEIDLGHKRYDQAARHFELSARSFSKHSQAKRYRIIPPSEATLYSKKGSALNHAKKVMAAVESYKIAISLSKVPKDKLAACTSLGNLYQSLGNNEEARKQYEETIVLAEQLGDFVSLGWAHGNIGNAYLGLFQRDKAFYHLEKALDLTVRNEPSPQAIGRAYNNLGTAYQSLGDVVKAEEYYDLALSQAIYGRDTGGQARAYGNIGNLLMIQKKYESAILHYTEAMGIGKDPATKSTAHHNRGCASYEKAEVDKKNFFERYYANEYDGTTPLQRLHSLTYYGNSVGHLPQAPRHLPTSVQSLYEQGRDDLMKVLETHEATIQTIKGSTQGLTLSVSVSETNSRTFHRLQDCLFNLGQWEEALKYAEQSRARSLGELMLQRKAHSLDMPLTSPLDPDQINRVLDRINMTVVYLSFTGSRLLAWVFTPIGGYTISNYFQVSMADDQFDGKTFDYYLRYSLSEILIESNLEMYSHANYEEQSPLNILFDLVGEPLLNILEAVYSSSRSSEPKDIVIIPDSFTNLMPMVALLNNKSQQFLGDKYRFRYMPSLLTMGILCQQPEVIVDVLDNSRNFCVVGNPSIPTFKYQGEELNLGKLPHATREAEWVSHILRCSPTLHDQATKMLILSMLNTAKVVHLATHGSVTGFLAFAGRGSSRSRDVADDGMVLLYPEEVEKLSISPALVVLSSCDSGRGVVKADGIQGMARAFILAGAKSVLTSLWRVPDESASTFMQFFYQYLMEGFVSSTALQKAILSVRAFAKYSRYIHWSGYQLTGRDVRLVAKRSAMDYEVRARMGVTAVFPRLHIVNKLEEELVKATRSPTDVQLVHGVRGLKPSEPVIDFINKFHSHFSGGVFWVNGTCQEFIRAAEIEIEQALSAVPSVTKDPALVVLDGFSSLPEPGALLSLLRSTTTHTIVLTHSLTLPDQLRKQVDQQLIRGLSVLPLKPMSRLHSTQRLVHSIVCEQEFAPLPREQRIIANIADRVGGSSTIVDITAALLRRCVRHCNDTSVSHDFLDEFTRRVLASLPKDTPESTITQFTSSLINGYQLSMSEQLLLMALSIFGPVPIPKNVVEKIQSFVMLAKPASEAPGTLTPVSNLLNARLLLVYPTPVIRPPSKSLPRQYSQPRRLSTDSNEMEEEADYFYVPQLVKDALRDTMRTIDEGVAITTAFKSLEQLDFLKKEESVRLLGVGLSRMLIEFMELREDEVQKKNLLDLNCYQELVGLYFNLRIGES